MAVDNVLALAAGKLSEREGSSSATGAWSGGNTMSARLLVGGTGAAATLLI